jgi:HSP20 family protein
MANLLLLAKQITYVHLSVLTTGTEQRKYHEVIQIPPQTDIETATSTYKNGILEIVFKKKQGLKPKGKEIKVE